MERNLTTGNVGKNILIFSLPYLLSYFLQTLYGMADLFIIGQFDGVASTTAVSIGSQVMHMLTVMLIGLAMGTTVSIARAVGGRNHKQVSENVGNTVTLFFGLSIVLTVVLLLLVRPIVGVMSTPAEAVDGTVAYLTICFLGIPFITAYNIISSIFRGMGDSKSPMRYLIAASIINVILDLILVGWLRMGVGAAAFATIASQTVSAILAFAKLTRSKEEWAVHWSEVRFDAPSLKAVVVQGLPSGIQNSVISIANVIVQSNINSFGAQAMAGCGAYSKVEGFAFLPVTCFSMALATFVSQNVGAGQPDRVRKGMKFGTLCSVLMAEIVGVGIYTLSPWLIGAFSREPDVIAFGVQQAHTAALFYCLLAFSHCCAGILRGLGRPVVPMMVMLMIWCALRITYITITLHFIRAISVVFWAYPLTWSISSALFAWYILHCPIPQLGGGAPAVKA